MERTKGESHQHKLMKNVVSSILKNENFDVKVEEKTTENFSVDVVGFSNEKTIVVECETLKYPCHNKLTTSFSKAILKYGKIEPILCIPKFAGFSEIWVMDESGEIIKYVKNCS